MWQSDMLYQPAESSKVAEDRLKGQQMLRDIYKAFADGSANP